MAEVLSPEEFAKRYAQPALAPTPATGESLSPEEFAKRYGGSKPDTVPSLMGSNPYDEGAMSYDYQIDGNTIKTPDGKAVAGSDGKPVDLAQGNADTLNRFAQNATFNYSDEAIAGVRSLLGEDYATALAQEREQLRQANERLGPGGKMIADAAAMLLPMGPIARLTQRLAGPGAGLWRTAGAAATTAAPLGGISAVGALENKSLDTVPEAFVKGAAVSGVMAPALVLGAGVAQSAGGRVTDTVLDLGRQAREYAHARGPNAHIPLQSTTNFATNRIANAAEMGGIRTPQVLGRELANNAVPNTPMALVNSGNDRLINLAGEQAQSLNNANVPRVVNGVRTDTNVWDALVRNQQRTTTGQTQAEALRTRIFDDNAIPARSRDLTNVVEASNADAERLGQQLGNIKVGGTTLPGFAQTVESQPAFQRAYRAAADRVRIPGSPDHIPPDQIPLFGQEYDDALAAFNAGNRATPPVRLTDRNVPATIYQSMLADASFAAKPADGATPGSQDMGRRMFGLLQDMGNNAANRSRAGRIVDTRDQLHDIHTRREDINAGFNMPAQDSMARTNAVAETRALPAPRQNDRRIGYVHGVADEVNKHGEDIGSLPGRLFDDMRRRDTFREMTQYGNAPARGVDAVRRDMENVGDMQDVGSALQTLSRSRSTESEALPAQAARAYVKYQFQPGAAYAWGLQRIVGGNSQARRGEIARLLTDTTGEGRQRLMDEINARIARRNLPPGLARLAIVNELSRRLGSAAGSTADQQE